MVELLNALVCSEKINFENEATPDLTSTDYSISVLAYSFRLLLIPSST